MMVRFDALPLSGDIVECSCSAQDVSLVIAGGFRRRESVVASKDLRVKGVVVVKQGASGTVVGQSATDPNGRVTIAFPRREDGRVNNLNVVPTEIQRMYCNGGLAPGDCVVARRQLMVVPTGTCGIVLGPSCASPNRVVISFEIGGSCEEVVLHVEPADLHTITLDKHADCAGPGVESKREDSTDQDSRLTTTAGRFTCGDEVVAARDLSVGGTVVVRTGVRGTVIGPSNQHALGPVTVDFAWREDGKTKNLNVVPTAIRLVDSPIPTSGELCAICLGELLSEGEELCRMPCSHVFHATCVRALLNHQTGTNTKGGRHTSHGLQPTRSMPPKPAQCPVCRRDALP